MKKILLLFLFLQTSVFSQDLEKTYFAGGCFWCMEESFEKKEGVLEVISGYSGGTTKNPTYKEVTYGKTGHFETIEVIFNKDSINYNDLLNHFWKNIDPFDQYGQFCDKGKSYRSVVFFSNNTQINVIKKFIKEIEKRFNKKVVTLIWQYKKFYKAEEYHQDYYQKNFIRYLTYKNACQRETTLNKIWK